jgi:putative ABC transport system ATP-binding protein
MTPDAERAPPAIELRQIRKIYEAPSGDFVALDDINLTVLSGEFIAVVGKSGSGKSTLINMIAGIDRPTSGEIIVGGRRIADLSESGSAIWRRRNVGVVFQFFQLLPTLTIVENVLLPMEFCDTYPAGRRRQRALALLSRVGIAEQGDKLPAALSGGQQQRAAIARALANNPAILVADEPTGNLDSRTADAVIELFSELAEGGTTVVVVTHERDVARFVDRTVTLVDGHIETDVSGLRAATGRRVGGLE